MADAFEGEVNLNFPRTGGAPLQVLVRFDNDLEMSEIER